MTKLYSWKLADATLVDKYILGYWYSTEYVSVITMIWDTNHFLLALNHQNLKQ